MAASSWLGSAFRCGWTAFWDSKQRGMLTQSPSWQRRSREYLLYLARSAKGALPFTDRGRNVRLWRAFARDVRARGDLLRALQSYPGAILVSGCQRSGGTALTAALTQIDGVADFEWRERWHGDRELAGAYVLAGLADIPHALGRQAFQTTYLNASYPEYLEADAEYQLVWLIRNPRSVVRSMVYNWSEFSLAELFESCGVGAYEQFPASFRTTRSRALARLTRACASYVGKNEQLHELAARIPSRLTVVSYDQLVQHPVEDLSALCRALGLGGATRASSMLRQDSLDKHETLSSRERQAVDELCSDAFRDALALAINRR